MGTGTFALALALAVAWMPFSVRGDLPFPNVLQKDWLQVDCGATNNAVNSLTTWRTDEEFVEKGQGQNKLLTTTKTPTEMNTLRFFPDGKKNCYKFSVSYSPYPYSNHLYLIRAGFYYGNYDNLSKPPVFDLQFDNTLWTTVATNTTDEPIFHEVMYNVLSEELQVCLVGTIDGMVPFISSLQVIPMQLGVCDQMDTNTTAFYVQSRTRFGSDKQVGDLDRPDEDEFNRIWKPRSMPNYRPLLPKVVPNGTSDQQYNLPLDVLSYAIEATNLTDSIYIPIDFPFKTPSSALFIFYFSSILQKDSENGTVRKVQIQINGNETKLVEISPTYGILEGAVFYPVTVVGTANVTISAAEGADLPAMINAMEVYTTIAVSHGEKSWKCSYYYTPVLFLVIHFLVHVPLSFGLVGSL